MKQGIIYNMTTYNNKGLAMPRKGITFLVILLMVLLGNGKAWGDILAQWDFKNNLPAGISQSATIQGTNGTGKVLSTVEGIVLDVDATASGAKFFPRGTDCQINKGTIIHVPVRRIGDEVTVLSYPGYYKYYTVGGNTVDNDLYTYKATATDVKNGYVEIEATGGAYVYSISVKLIEEKTDKLLYSTNFDDWDALGSSTNETAIQKKGTTGQDITFYFSETQIAPAGVNTSKFNYPPFTVGYAMAAKTATPYIKTSKIEGHVSRVKFVHGATGNNRGWGLKVKGKGDADWVTVSDAVADPPRGVTVEVEIDKEDVELWFYNLNASNNAYMGSLEIYYEEIPRSFSDFKIDFRSENYKVTLPEDGNLPDGVTVDGGTFNDAQHGYQNAVVTVQVDGPVKFTIGGCANNTKDATVSIDGGEPISINTKTSGCDNATSTDHYVTYTYNKKVYNANNKHTLTFNLGDYCPYFHAEQVPYQCIVTYYDTDGKEIKKEEIDENTPLTLNEDATNHVNDAVPSGSKFRGWFYGNNLSALKAKDRHIVSDDLNLYPKVTLIEKLYKGNSYTFDLTKDYFYVEDHDILDITGGAYNGEKKGHGWYFENGGKVTMDVAAKTKIMLYLCNNSSSGQIQIYDKNNYPVGNAFASNVDSDGTTVTVDYDGPATTLWFDVPSGTFIHSIYLKETGIATLKFVNKYENTLLGTVPDDIEALNDMVYIPENNLLYRPDWTVVGWTDGTTIYNLSTSYNVTESATLYPVLQKNTQELSDNNNSGNSAVWFFDQIDGCPAINLSSTGDSKLLTYTECIEINGEKHDVPLIIDASKGKIDNTDSRVNGLGSIENPNAPVPGGQINNGTVLTIPAVYGMKVIFHASLKADNAFGNNTTYFGTGDRMAQIDVYEGETRVEGVIFQPSDNNRTGTYTYTGDATTINLHIVNAGNSSTASWGFFRDLTVEYPVLPNVISDNIIVNTDKIETEEHPTNAGVVTITSSSASHANTGKRFKVGDEVTITATANYGYAVNGFRVKGASTSEPGNQEGTESSGQGTESSGQATTTSAGIATLPTQQTYTYTVTEGETTIEVLFERLTMYKVTAIAQPGANNIILGEVSLSPKYDNFYKKTDSGVIAYYTESTEVTASAEAKEEYIIDQWKDGETVSTTNTITITMGAADRTLIASFKKGFKGSVVYSWGTEKVNGVTPAYKNAASQLPERLSDVYSFTVPTNYTFFKNIDDSGESTDNSYTLEHWKGNDGNIYELGKAYSFTQEGTLTLTPYFVYNPATQENRLNNPIIRYDFGTGVRSYDDPTSGETRKVCAQKVKIANNTNVFWTSKVYVEVLDNGTKLPHTRDVAMWVNTGEKGYIRNGDLPEWASFGPGTTFWLASCAGTKISLLSYAPITSTTIDGHVPTLDTEDPRCKPEEHQYVYSYTTDNADLRIPLVIGDDYSYYQWFEVATLSANMVNLHTEVNDELRGEITSIASESEYAAEELEDGGYAFHQGNRVKLTLQRKFGYELDMITDPNKIVNGEPLPVLKMNSDGTVTMVKPNNSYETEVVAKNADGTWGNENTTFIVKVTETDDNRTKYEVSFNITTHRDLKIIFREKKTYYVTYNPGKMASGTAPSAQWVEPGDEFVVPDNRTLYYEGNTLKYWKDSEYDDSKSKDENKDEGHVFEIGKTYKAVDKDIRLFPVFEPNGFNILDVDDKKAVWDFTTQNGAPAIAYERSKGILVTQLVNDDNDWIDLKIDLDATVRKVGSSTANGKFNNTAYVDRIQVNNYSVINFPNTKGSTASLTAVGDISQQYVAGLKKGDNGFTVSDDKKTITVVCPRDGAVDSVEFKASCYPKSFSVKYKKQDTTTKPTLTTLMIGETPLTAEELSTMKSSDNKSHTHSLTPPDTGEDVIMPKVTGTADNNGVVTATMATIDKPVSTVTVATAGGVIVETYTINFNFIPSSNAENLPKITSVKVNGKACELTGTVALTNQPVNGVIEIGFSRTMKAKSFVVNDNGYEATLSAEQGKTLKFKYWDLPVGKTFRISLSNIFEDIYGMICSDNVTLNITSASTTIPIEHRTFNYIVGVDGDIDGAIEAANGATGTDRYYIFVPDGVYELKGNDPLNKYGMTSDGKWPCDENGIPRDDMLGKNNGMTKLTRANVSLIGQSQKGVQIYNHPIVEGIGYTSTLHTDKTATDFYAEELTMENRFQYWRSTDGQATSLSAGRAVVFWDQGNRSIMKNVELWSWQDTYYSSNVSSDYRGYFENCVIAGCVDWFCGNGDIWIEKSDIVVRDRSGNNIVASSTDPGQQWGYVFNECRIIPETDNPIRFKDNDWTFARPWNSSPACTFIKTKMSITPRSAGWSVMTNGLVLRFHEYKSMDTNGTLLPLGTRSLVASSPAAGSDDCILTDNEAAAYTIRAVMGGTDSFDPVSLTKQIDAKTAAAEEKDPKHSYEWDAQIELDDDRLQWKTEPMALCYFVFKKNTETGKWEYRANVAQQSDDETLTGLSLERFGSGTYMVRAANQRGGLGAPTEEIDYVEQDKYTLTITQTEGAEAGYGWSTICLPYNAKNPASESITMYAGKEVSNYVLTLQPVDIINKDRGYVVYGKVGEYVFKSSSHSSDVETILDGNSSSVSIDKGNINCYVLANKPTTYGIGFYKYTGNTLAANKAWLPISKVTSDVETLDTQRAVLLSIRPGDGTSILSPGIVSIGWMGSSIYDLNGLPVRTPIKGHVYIVNGQQMLWR